MEHAANQWDDFFWLPRSQANNPSPAAFGQGGLLSTRSGHNWLVEHNVLRHAKVALFSSACDGLLPCLLPCHPHRDVELTLPRVLGDVT